jgi:hypothetical protein
MGIYKKKLFVLSAIIVVYLMIDIGLQNAAIYLVGGMVGGTIKEVIKLLGFPPTNILTYSTWLTILTIFIILNNYTRSGLLHIFLIPIIGIMLYIVDFLLIEVGINQSLIVVVALFLRSVILTIVSLKSSA